MPERKSDHTLSSDFDGPIAAGGGDAVDMRSSQGPIYKPSGDVKQHFGLALYVPLAGVALLAVALVIAAMVFNIGPLTALLPTPMPFKPAAEGESLIIVADFEDRSAGKYHGVDPAQYIYERIAEQARADALDMRIERLHEVVNDNSVRHTGEAYSATMVLWGWYDALTITPQLARIETRSDYRSTEEGLHFSLVDPQTIEFSIVTDLPIQSTYLTLFTLGVDEFTTQNNQRALTYFSSALESIPQDENVSVNPNEAYFYRGTVYLLETEYEKALIDLDRALELNPNAVEAYIHRGNALIRLGKPQKGLQSFNFALAIDSEYQVEAYIGKGVAYLNLGDYPAALEALDEALEINPDHFGAYNNRGNVYFELDKDEQALKDYTKALELNPKYAGAYYNRGLNYSYLEEYEKAIADCSQALDLNPKYVEAYYNRGLNYYYLGQYEQALGDYTQALELNPQHAKAFYSRGLIYKDLASYEKAIADFTQALQQKPEYTDAYYGRGFTYKRMGLMEDAVADFERFLDLSSDPYWQEQAKKHLQDLQKDQP